VPDEERAPLRDWSLAILGALEPTLSDEQLERGNRAVREFLLYLEGLVERRRAEPGDPEVDVLTRLIAGEGGETLSAPELLHNCIFLLNAGHETTTNLIGNGLACLLDWPDEKARLLAEPALVRTRSRSSCASRARTSSATGSRRCATEIDGVALAPRTSVTIGIGAANRDPAAFADPDRLDIARARTGTSRSARASTSASAWGWARSRAASPSAASSRASRLPARRARGAAAARPLSRPRAPARRRRFRCRRDADVFRRCGRCERRLRMSEFPARPDLSTQSNAVAESPPTSGPGAREGEHHALASIARAPSPRPRARLHRRRLGGLARRRSAPAPAPAPRGAAEGAALPESYCGPAMAASRRC
jgi:hypothetical protein